MSNAVATRPSASLRELMRNEKTQEELLNALPKFLSPQRFTRIALNMINRVPALEKCSQRSVMTCFMECASLGIEPDGRRAHIIPYGDKATLIIDYKGLIELAKRNGDVATWRPVAVKEGDKFSWVNGDITHEIDWMKDRGELKAVYSHVRMKDGTDDYEVMTLAECESIRKRSKAGSSGPWVSDYEAMCLKTVMRRHSKRLVLSPEFRDALEVEEKYDPLELAKPAPVVVEQAPRLFGRAEPMPQAEAVVVQPAAKPDLPDDDDQVPMGTPEDDKAALVHKIETYGGNSKAQLKHLSGVCRDHGADVNDLGSANVVQLDAIAKAIGVAE